MFIFNSNEIKLMLFNITNKIIIVTGGNSGIGLTISKSLIKFGAVVIRLDKKFKSKTFNVIKKNVTNLDIEIDLSDTKKIPNLLKKIKKNFKRIDGLINCHGITKEINNNTDLSKNFDETINNNLKSTFVLSSLVCKQMSKKNGGSVVNITSLGAHLGFPNNPSYQMSKAGVRQLTKSLAIDWGKKLVRVNNICPGYIKSTMTMKSYKNSRTYKKRLDRMMLNRWGTPEDIVGATIFLISDASSYITGSDIYVDGGWVAKGL